MNALKHNLFSAIDFLIRIESGPDQGKAFRLQPPQIVIGRDPRCTISLTDPKVSRQQCVIRFKNNIICDDLSGKGSTLVNGQPARNTMLRPGDRIQFGQTTILFETRTRPEAQGQLPGQKSEPTVLDQDKEQTKKNMRLFMFAIIGLLVIFQLTQEEVSAPPEEKLVTSEDLQKQIEESQQRTSLLREQQSERRPLPPKRYLYNVERHFISGFRDFQNGKYGRALEAFGTTIATDQNHTRAQLYSKSARKKRADLVDSHIQDGQKYKDKLMYNRCASEFEKALVLINDVNSNKYSLAKAQLEECRYLMSGGKQ